MARNILTPIQFDVFAQILRIRNSNQKRRDKLVHHAWGYSLQIKNAFLLLDPKDAILGAGREKIFVYKKDDFEHISRDNENLSGIIFQWKIFFNRLFENDLPSEGIFRALCEELGVPET